MIIKTFVTTDLQKAIAKKFGLRCVETLTGFKYIGAKLGKYEAALPPEPGVDYRDLPEEETRRRRLAHSSFYVFGGEESYCYSGADFVGDKDGNGAAIMFCEVAAYAKSLRLTIDGLLDQIYAEFGYYLEKNGALTFEGAEGAARIQRLLATYVEDPPNEMLECKVTTVRNYETDTIRDIEGDEIPKEKMLIFELADRTRVAVRGSGTVKNKYYLFAAQPGARSSLCKKLTRSSHRSKKSWRDSGSGCRPTRRDALLPNGVWTAGVSRSISRMDEINLNGGEITILKTIGLSGGMMAGAQLADRMDEMEGAEFLEALASLMATDYVVSNKVNIRTMDAVKSASFRVNRAFARDLKDAVYPSRQKKADTGRRKRRS